MRCIALLGAALRCIALRCDVVWVALNCVALRGVAMRCDALWFGLCLANASKYADGSSLCRCCFASSAG